MMPDRRARAKIRQHLSAAHHDLGKYAGELTDEELLALPRYVMALGAAITGELHRRGIKARRPPLSSARTWAISRDLPLTASQVLVTLAEFAGDGFMAEVARVELAFETGLSERTLEREIRKLRDAGLVFRPRQQRFREAQIVPTILLIDDAAREYALALGWRE